MEVFWCYCFFDICCLSKIKNEEFNDLGLWLSTHMTKMYADRKKKGFCRCSACRPCRLRTNSMWVLRTLGDKAAAIAEKRFVVCKDHVERIIDNMELNICEKINVSGGCQCKPLFSKRYTGEHPSCFYCYQEEITTLFGFCTACKVYFASSTEFQLKRVKIDRNGKCSTPMG